MWNGVRPNFISELQSLKDILVRHVPSLSPLLIYATGHYSSECDSAVIHTVTNYQVYVQIITFFHRGSSRAISHDTRGINKSHLIQ